MDERGVPNLPSRTEDRRVRVKEENAIDRLAMPSQTRHVERQQCTLVEEPSRPSAREPYSVHRERRQGLLQSGTDRDRELFLCRFSKSPEDAQNHGAYAAGVLGRGRVDQEHEEA